MLASLITAYRPLTFSPSRRLKAKRNNADTGTGQVIGCRLLALRDKTFGNRSSSFLRAKKTRRIPVVLSVEEVQALFSQLSRVPLLMAEILYGTSLRLGGYSVCGLKIRSTAALQQLSFAVCFFPALCARESLRHKYLRGHGTGG